jgi:hypothetical protein
VRTARQCDEYGRTKRQEEERERDRCLHDESPDASAGEGSGGGPGEVAAVRGKPDDFWWYISERSSAVA